MKTKFISKIITVCFSVVILLSCESHAKKADDAFDLYKEKKMHPQDSNLIVKEITPKPKEKVSVKKNENIDAWTLFKLETNKKIHANERLIKELKNSTSENAKTLKRVSALEKNNYDLNKQMDEYNEKMKVSFENFKTEMNHDVDEIGIELNNIAINNKQ